MKKILAIIIALCAFHPALPMRMHHLNEWEMWKLERQAQSYATAKHNKLEKAEMLMRKKAEILMKSCIDVTKKDTYGDTALLRAARDQNTHLCKLLLDAGAQVNAQNDTGQTALMYACRAGSKPLCELLLQRGADIELENKSGKNAYKIAHEGRYRNITCLFEWYLVKANELTSAIIDQATSKVQKLVTQHPEIINSPTGLTPLMFASGYGYLDICRLLLKAGALIHLKGDRDLTAFDLASMGNHPDIIELLNIYAKDTLKNRVLRKIIEADEIELSKIFDDRVTETQLSVLPSFIEIDRDRAECIN